MSYLKEFILKVFNKTITFIEKNIDLFGGTIISVILAYIVNWKSDQMQTIYTFILMLLLCIGLVRVFKNKDNKNKNDNNCYYDEFEESEIENLEYNNKNTNSANIKSSQKKSKLGLLKKVVDSQKPLKAIRLSQYPMSEGEELGEIIKETMKGGKIMKQKIITFLKQIWGNKVTLINFILSFTTLFVMNYLTFSGELKSIEIFATNEIWIKWVVPILSLIYAIVDVFTTITKYGWENPTELTKKAEQKALEKASRLSKEQKAFVKEEIEKVKSEIEKYETELLHLDSIIKNFEVLKSLAEKRDYKISQEKATDYEKAMEKKPDVQLVLVNLKDNLSALEETLK